MEKLRTKITQLACTVGAAALLGAATIPEAVAQDRNSVRWATSDTGSYGYSVGSLISQLLEENLEGEYAVTVQPYPSTTAAMKAVMGGEAEFSYTADVGMKQLYAKEGPFEGFEASQGMLVHTLYVYPMETFMVVPTANAEQYKSYADLNGKPVFFTPAGYMNWLNMGRIWQALGYEFNHVEIDNSTVADALQQGSVEGSAAYTTAGASLPTWWKEAELRADISVVNPSDEEIEKLRAAGLAPKEVDPAQAFSQDVGVEKILGVPIWFGYNVRADMDPELVQNILNVLNDNVAKLAEGDPGFKPLAEDFVGAQVGGIAANPDIPVHPGLAAFLKEHNAWNDSWKIAGES